jgi:HEAT repeat protein
VTARMLSTILKIVGETQNFLMSRILLAGLKDTDVSLQSSAAKFLSNSKDPAVTELLAHSLDDPNPRLRANATKLLQQMREMSSVPALIQSLDAPAKAKAAATALGQTGDRRAVIPLLSVIQRLPSSCPLSCACCEEPNIRPLGALGDRRAVRPLLEILSPMLSSTKISYSHRLALATVIEALGNLRDSQAVPVLIAALRGLSPDISSASAMALGRIKDKRAVDALVEALDYEHRRVRESAARALGEIGDIRASSALVARLSTCDMQEAVASALIQLKWQPQTDRDRIYFLLSQSRWDEIAENWKSNRKILLKDLKRSRQETMEGAVWPLIAMGDKAVVGDLIAALQARGTDRMARLFFNCGQPQLAEASIRWALNEGMDILDLEMEPNLLEWGARNLDGIFHHSEW